MSLKIEVRKHRVYILLQNNITNIWLRQHYREKQGWNSDCDTSKIETRWWNTGRDLDGTWIFDRMNETGGWNRDETVILIHQLIQGNETGLLILNANKDMKHGLNTVKQNHWYWCKVTKQAPRNLNKTWIFDRGRNETWK